MSSYQAQEPALFLQRFAIFGDRIVDNDLQTKFLEFQADGTAIWEGRTLKLVTDENGCVILERVGRGSLQRYQRRQDSSHHPSGSSVEDECDSRGSPPTDRTFNSVSSGESYDVVDGTTSQVVHSRGTGRPAHDSSVATAESTSHKTSHETSQMNHAGPLPVHHNINAGLLVNHNNLLTGQDHSEVNHTGTSSSCIN